MWWHGNWGWGSWLAMSLSMLVFWGLVIWVVATLVRSPGTPREPSVDPERILAERFARGEINEDDYRRRLDALRSVDGPEVHAGSRP